MALSAARLSWFGRIETRIGAAIVAAIFSIVVIALAKAAFTSPTFVVYERDWLTAAVVEITAKATTLPQTERNAALAALPASQWLSVAWLSEEPRDRHRPRPPPPHLDHRFGKQLEDALHNVSKSVRIAFGRPSRPPLQARFEKGQPSASENLPPPRPGPPPYPGRRNWFTPDDYNLTIVPPAAAGTHRTALDHVVPAHFDIAVELVDGSWLHITPKLQRSYTWVIDIVLPLLAGAIVIVAFSIRTARRILAPLHQLAQATRKLGVERNPAPIPTKGLHEFVIVADALNDMHRRLSSYVEERTQMLAAVSHDIRTALTRLNLTAEDVADPAVKSMLNEQIAEMEAMIAATLVFARTDAQNERVSEVDLAALLISLCDAESDRGRRIAYEGPDHLNVSCQRLTLKWALTNLIDNALKYGERAHVSLRANGPSVEIDVRDWGPGIPSHFRERAFAPFQRLESSRNRNTGGVGLGLTIAQDAIRAHGGRISLQDAPGGGLNVHVELPA